MFPKHAVFYVDRMQSVGSASHAAAGSAAGLGLLEICSRKEGRRERQAALSGGVWPDPAFSKKLKELELINSQLINRDFDVERCKMQRRRKKKKANSPGCWTRFFW